MLFFDWTAKFRWVLKSNICFEIIFYFLKVFYNVMLAKKNKIIYCIVSYLFCCKQEQQGPPNEGEDP